MCKALLELELKRQVEREVVVKEYLKTGQEVEKGERSHTVGGNSSW